MKTISKLIIGLCIAGSLIFGLTDPANAQRGDHMAGFNRAALNMRTTAPEIRVNGFYHPYVYPKVGVIVHTLPAGYYTFFWNTYPFYYYDGLFYQSYADGSYQVVTPPIGAQVPSIPLNAEIITIDGNPYYEYQGVYYEPVIIPDGKIAYKVVGKDGIMNTNSQPDPALPLVGDVTDSLPDGAHRITLSGKTYWVTPEEVYLEEVKKDKTTSYRVVWVPEKKHDQPAQAQGNKSNSL